ncbi:hypothetical protein HK097_009121 [Rhizophlyctis rosea]|uniref:Uncharacterized protein n=1 Tax=Rhizophlyctis rosea TaxID=64517 RepID=A0AAD5SIS0_9FUNG|nr:hypothetical protein HK097_009121 [Rhizophlyctis rosea]
MFVDEHAQCGCESTRQSLAFLTNATDTLQAVLAETLDLQNLLAFQSLLLADRSSRLLSNILRDSPTTHPSFYHLTVNLAIWSLIPRIPSEPSLDGTESQNSEQSRCPSIPTSFHNLCMVQLLPLSRHGKDAWVECTTVVYHFGARILETIQNLAKRDAAASGDLPQGENGNEENLDAQEKEGQGEGDIFRFDFLSQFWTSFLNGIVKMEQDETVIVAVENLTIVQTFEIVRPSTNPHGRPSRKNLLCLGYQFKCGDGSVAIVKVS